MHVRLQTWFPLQIQVYVNGHEWLARKLKKNGIRYCKREMPFSGSRTGPELKNSPTAFVLRIGLGAQRLRQKD